MDNVQKHLQQSLILIVASGRGKNHERLAIFQNERRCERDARAFTRRDDVGAVRISQSGLQSLTHQHACIAKDDVLARARILKKGRRVNVGEVDLVDAGNCPVARVLTTFILTTSSFDYLPGQQP